MIPLALALVGGYFIGDALKKKQVFAEGGDVYFPYFGGISLLALKDSGVLSRELDSCSDDKILKIYSDLKSKEYQQKIKQKYQNGKLRVTREQAIDYILKFADGGMMAEGGVMDEEVEWRVSGRIFLDDSERESASKSYSQETIDTTVYAENRLDAISKVIDMLEDSRRYIEDYDLSAEKVMAHGGVMEEKYVIKADKDGTYKILNKEKEMYVDHVFETKKDAEGWKKEKDREREMFGFELKFAKGGRIGFPLDKDTIEKNAVITNGKYGKWVVVKKMAGTGFWEIKKADGKDSMLLGENQLSSWKRVATPLTKYNAEGAIIISLAEPEKGKWKVGKKLEGLGLWEIKKVGGEKESLLPETLFSSWFVVESK